MLRRFSIRLLWILKFFIFIWGFEGDWLNTSFIITNFDFCWTFKHVGPLIVFFWWPWPTPWSYLHTFFLFERATKLPQTIIIIRNYQDYDMRKKPCHSTMYFKNNDINYFTILILLLFFENITGNTSDGKLEVILHPWIMILVNYYPKFLQIKTWSGFASMDVVWFCIHGCGFSEILSQIRSIIWLIIGNSPINVKYYLNLLSFLIENWF